MTINASQAIDIAADYKEEEPVGIMTNGRDFVVGFADQDPFDNLTVLVDGETGESRALSVQEYTKMMPELRPAE
jgi:hypothetical protein